MHWDLLKIIFYTSAAWPEGMTTFSSQTMGDARATQGLGALPRGAVKF